MKSIFDDWKMIALACLTIGLAPFLPEPHIWGKLKWLIGGANGMKIIDWGDLLLHGSPWVLMIIVIVKRFFKRSQGQVT
ncbi:MAG: hypothetical protein JNK41_01545 [Saprospiraceae bacterium]|jgi:hypothetical protein|nr:hypothetical protein [Saprospiraceae bacterium]